MSPPIAAKSETGSLGVLHLKRFWSRRLASRSGQPDSHAIDDECNDFALLSGLRLGNRETFDFIFQTLPSFEQFEAWILEKNGGALDPDRVSRLNASLDGSDEALSSVTFPNAGQPVFSKEEMLFWEENGYVILHDAVTPDQCQAAAQAIYEFLGMDPDQPGTWYGGQLGQSLWVPLLHHPAFWANRDSPHIHRAFAQLWGRNDLWVSVDQGGFNPPLRPGWHYPGQPLHFDVSLEPPVPFGVQGILYLTDTTADQGAFTCVPGFHRIIESWLANLRPGADARKQDFASMGAVPIAGRAGDLVIWHQALPHSSSPNHSTRPRVAQYIKMQPSKWEFNPIWR